MEEQLVVVMEKKGFITSKKIKDISPSDEIMCKVKDEFEAEVAIHGTNRGYNYTIEEDSDGIKVFRRL